MFYDEIFNFALFKVLAKLNVPRLYSAFRSDTHPMYCKMNAVKIEIHKILAYWHLNEMLTVKSRIYQHCTSILIVETQLLFSNYHYNTLSTLQSQRSCYW